MPAKTVEAKPAANARDQWRDRFAEHARSGLSIKYFCKDHGIADIPSTRGANGCRKRRPRITCSPAGLRDRVKILNAPVVSYAYGAQRGNPQFDRPHPTGESAVTEFVQDASYAGHFGEYRKLLDRLVHHDPAIFELPKDWVIADVGCGFGGMLDLMRRRGYTNLIGVEPDAECRRSAAARGLKVWDGTLANTGLPDAYVDAVIVNQVFHHISDYAGALDEGRRILKNGGVLCFFEPLNTPLRWAMDFLTFQTPLRKIAAPVETRYRVMKLEMDTGMYPQFLREQQQFRAALDKRFRCLWRRRRWLFQFGKYQKVIGWDQSAR